MKKKLIRKLLDPSFKILDDNTTLSRANATKIRIAKI